MISVRMAAGAVAFVLAALQITACTPEREAPPPARPSLPAPVASGPAELTPLTVGDRPLWASERRTALSGIDRAEIRGDSVIMLEESGDDERGLVVLDASTGKQRWSIRGLDELVGGRGAYLWPTDRFAQVIGAGAWSVIVPYMRERAGFTSEYGFATLAGADGSVQRMSPVVRGGAESESDELTLRDEWWTDGRTLVAGLRPRGAEQELAGESTTQALDLTSGTVEWTRKRQDAVSPSTIAGDVLVAFDSCDDMVGLELRTGRQLWTLAGRYGLAGFHDDEGEFAAGELLAVQVAGQDMGRTVFLRTRTGAELLSVEQVSDCVSDRRELFACTLARDTSDQRTDDRLLTVAAGDGAARVSGKRIDAAPSGIWRGRIIAGGSDGGSSHAASYDRAGNELGGLPGDFEAVSGRYALLWTGRSHLGLYRRG